MADDDPVVLEDLCERLQSSHEFQDVRPFGRISEAIAYIQTHPVALFITDIEFPDGQLGFKHLSDVPFTPVILMSVHSRYMLEHIADIAANKNLAGYVPKPVTEDVCRAIIQRYRVIRDEGLDQSVVKAMARVRTIELYRFDTVKGDWFRQDREVVMDKRYGVQVSIDEARAIKPTGERQIKAFLACGLFKGIGTATAQKGNIPM